MSAPLPTEILHKIIHLVPDIASLRCITQTSQRFLVIGEPLLYRDVVFTCSNPNVDPTPAERSRYELFCRQVSIDGGRLGRHVVSLQIDSDRGEYFTKAFPFLSNLRRLAIYLRPNHCEIWFNPAARLTHLTWNATPTHEGDEPLLAVLSSQPTLQYLKLHDGVDLAILKQLTRRSLPSLRSLTCSTDAAAVLLPVCNITTLITKSNDPFGLLNLDSESVTTLSYDYNVFPGPPVQISMPFPNLKQFMYMTASEIALSDLGPSLLLYTEDSSLEYLCLQIHNNTVYEGFIVRELERFPQVLPCFPKLRTLDVLIFRDEGSSPCARICFEEGVASPPIYFRRDTRINHRWFEWWQTDQFVPIINDIIFGSSSTAYPSDLEAKN